MPAYSLSDEDLIAGCVEGKKGSWDIFVERFSKLIYWGIQKTLEGSGFQKRKELVDEIFQEVFERLLQGEPLERLKNLKSVRRFLIVIACRAAMDKIKSLTFSEKKSARIELGATGEEGGKAGSIFDVPASGTLEPNTRAASAEREAVVGSVLGKLSPKERACVEFYYMDEKTHREIGLILGMPQDTVSTVIRRAKDRLKADFTRRNIKDF